MFGLFAEFVSAIPAYHTNQFDYLFIGAGASSSLLIMRMHQRGLLKGKRIAVLEPDTKQVNDKTYCFWGSDSDQALTICPSLIKHQWPRVRINQSQPQSIDPLQYMQVSSLDLYTETRSILSEYNVIPEKKVVLELIALESGTEVVTDQGAYISVLVFDSRPPIYNEPTFNQSHLLQSFIGYVVELEHQSIDASCVDLMDFNIDQQSSTQFVYVLPYANNQMLVELTRFDENPILEAEAKPLLDTYIRNRFGSYRLLDIETGCIPMSNASIKMDILPGVVSLGARAGAIKPSTGYGFKNMALHAIKICASLEKNSTIPSIPSRARFAFYDRLLLYILRTSPSSGKPIFDALFKKNEAKTVLTFLEEKSSPIQELKLFLSLPKAPFINALINDLRCLLRQHSVAVIALLFSLVLWWLQRYFPSIFDAVLPAVFAIGLIGVGIPHGALDHLLDRNKIQHRIELQFVIKYLGAALAYGLVWMMNSTLALVFFLLYSMWHFGQTDMEQWRLNRFRNIKSSIWGLMLFAILLIGHLQETNLVLNNLDVPIIQLPDGAPILLSFIFVGLAAIWSIMEKSFAMLLSVMMLGVGMQLPLTCAFGLYFIGQHSMHGWMHLKRGLAMNSKSLYVKALPFTLGALGLFLGAYLIAKSNRISASPFNWELVFYVFISCISFPHVLAMSIFYKKNSKLFR